MAKDRPLREDEILANIANEARLKGTPKPMVLDPATGQLREVTSEEASSFGVPIGPSMANPREMWGRMWRDRPAANASSLVSPPSWWGMEDGKMS